MADHLATSKSTQEANPGKAVNRTLLVTILAAFPVLNAALAVTLQELQPYVGTLPGWVFGALNIGLVVTTVLIGIFTRIMAIPAVSDFFRKYVPALAPDGKQPGTVEETRPEPAAPAAEQPIEQYASQPDLGQ